MKSDLCPNTARHYVSTGLLPSAAASARTWRTRPDPFADVWLAIEVRLLLSPTLQANTIFDDLVAKHPGRYEPGQLRTLQRRVRIWRARSGPGREPFFPQEHRAGEAAQVDFTWATELAITIRGEAYPHMLCHFVLPHSNWAWATPCRSESSAALSEGLQDAFAELGGVTAWVQTDNSTAATHDLRTGKRGFNAYWLALVTHYGARARTTGVGEKEQNGDVESLNGALKRYLEQQLLLRGSRDFESHDAYRAWLRTCLEARNATRGARLDAERLLLHALPARRVPCYREIDVRVTQGSTISVMGHPYSVPTRLIGSRVKVRVHETRIEVIYADVLELCVERGRGKGAFTINYRHVITAFVRKPGAFRNYRYREALFPTQTFRETYERLSKDLSGWGADVEYLRILELAARTMETTVEAVLAEALANGATPRFEHVRTRVLPAPDAPPDMAVLTVDLSTYDGLIGTQVEKVAS